MSNSRQEPKRHRCNICGIEFDTIEALNAHKRMEHSETSHLPAGID